MEMTVTEIGTVVVAELRASGYLESTIGQYAKTIKALGCGSFRVRGSCPTTECGPSLTDLVRARLRGRIR